MIDITGLTNKKLKDLTVAEFRCVLRDILGNYQPIQYLDTSSRYVFIDKPVTNPNTPTC